MCEKALEKVSINWFHIINYKLNNHIHEKNPEGFTSQTLKSVFFEYPSGHDVAQVKLLKIYPAKHDVQLSWVEPKQKLHLLSQGSQVLVWLLGNIPELQTYLQVELSKYNPSTHEWQSLEVTPLHVAQV